MVEIHQDSVSLVLGIFKSTTTFLRYDCKWTEDCKYFINILFFVIFVLMCSISQQCILF